MELSGRAGGGGGSKRGGRAGEEGSNGELHLGVLLLRAFGTSRSLSLESRSRRREIVEQYETRTPGDWRLQKLLCRLT